MPRIELPGLGFAPSCRGPRLRWDDEPVGGELTQILGDCGHAQARGVCDLPLGHGRRREQLAQYELAVVPLDGRAFHVLPCPLLFAGDSLYDRLV